MLHKYVCVFYGEKVQVVRQKYSPIVNVTSGSNRKQKTLPHTYFKTELSLSLS